MHGVALRLNDGQAIFTARNDHRAANPLRQDPLRSNDHLFVASTLLPASLLQFHLIRSEHGCPAIPREVLRFWIYDNDLAGTTGNIDGGVCDWIRENSLCVV